jgi:hypothetical protein
VITLFDVIAGVVVYLGLSLGVALLTRLIGRLQARHGDVRWPFVRA